MPTKLTNMVIKEVSGVDVPANGRKFLIVKRAEELFYKKKYSEDERTEMAESGEAKPDGSFPIKDAEDVENAVHDWGRAGAAESDKKHIISRAKAVGAEDKLPDDWVKKGGKKPIMKTVDKIIQRIKKWAYYQDNDNIDEAIDFDAAIEDIDADELLSNCIVALQTSIDSILDDDTVANKSGAIMASLNQFFTKLTDGLVGKSGRKISSANVSALKEIHTQLGNFINNANADPGDDAPSTEVDTGPTDPDQNNPNPKSINIDLNKTKGRGNVAKEKDPEKKFPDGHPDGCMCGDCKDVRDNLAKSANTKQVPEEVLKRMDNLEKRNQELESQVKKQQDEIKNKEYITKAAGFQGLSIKPEEFGLVLKSLAEKDPDNYAKVEAVLKSADKQVVNGALYSEQGRDGLVETSIEKRVEGMAAEMVTKNAGMSKAEAIAKVYHDNPDLYKQHLKELRGEK